MIRNGLVVALLMLVSAASAAAQSLQDVVTVGTVTATSSTVVVPVYIRDVSGTPLGIDQPPGSRIQAYSLKVDYAPTSAVQSVTFSRAGITAPLTPSAEFTPSTPGSVSLIDAFDESTNPIPFTLNAPAPGNQVGQLFITLAPGVPAGTVITLSLDAALTQLSNQAGTLSETVNLGTLALVNGSVTVSAAAVSTVPTLTDWGAFALVLLVAFIAVRRT